MTTRQPFSDELKALFQRLDDFIVQYNAKALDEGYASISRQEIKIVGQVALLLASLPFSITSTNDIDHVSRINHVVLSELRRLLMGIGLSVESDTGLIWMPVNTRYHEFYSGICLRVLYANHADVIQSKAKFNRDKDKRLIATYKNYFGPKD